MRALRGCSTFVGIGWLLLQLCALAAPLAASQLDEAPQASAAATLCVCPAGEDPACPMHQEAARQAVDAGSDDAATCTIRSTCTPLEYAILSLQMAAVLPDGVALLHDTRATSVDVPTPFSLTRPDLPDLPPPRS